MALRMLIAWLHLIQPLARLLGRIRHGVGPWRWTGLLRPPVRLRHTARQLERGVAVPLKHALRRSRECCCASVQAVKKGGDFDHWDLEVCGGLFGCVRAVAMIEEHGAGKQVFRLRAWPQNTSPGNRACFFSGFSCNTRCLRSSLACRSCARGWGAWDCTDRSGRMCQGDAGLERGNS